MKTIKHGHESDESAHYDEVIGIYVEFLSGRIVYVDHCGGNGTRSNVNVLEHFIGGEGTFYYAGEQLSGDRTFRHYGIQDGATLQVIMRNPDVR